MVSSQIKKQHSVWMKTYLKCIKDFKLSNKKISQDLKYQMISTDTPKMIFNITAYLQ